MKFSVQHGRFALLTCLAVPGHAQVVDDRAPAAATSPAPPALAPAADQAAEALDDDSDTDEDLEEEIVVEGVRQRGAVDTDIPPEVQLRSRAIRALGVGTVEDVLEELAPQARARGEEEEEPVVLLNGRRVSSFDELRDLPPEAIYRVDVFPQEASLQYGYPADRRLVNFVLRKRYKSLSLQGRYTYAPKRSRSTYRGKSTLLRLKPDRRWHVDLDLRREEGVRNSDDGDPGFGESLVPRTDRLIANGVLNQAIGAVSATVNTRLRLDRSKRRLFYPGAVPTLAGREDETVSGHGGLSLNGDLRDWRWSLIGNLDISDTDSRDEEMGASDLVQRASTRIRLADTSLLASGSLAELPAGPLGLAVEAGVSASDLKSDASGLVLSPARELDRSNAHGQFSLDVPLASRREGIGGRIGDLAANLNSRVERVSGFGTLAGWGYGLRWKPAAAVTVVATRSHEEEAPTLERLGEALELEPSLRVFDYRLGQTAPAILFEGGSAGLRAERRNITNVRVQAQPAGSPQLTLSAEYTRSRIRDALVTNIGPTLAVEAALPGRFTRDAGGNLSTFDARPVNFDRVSRQQIRWGANYTTGNGPSSPKKAMDQALEKASGSSPADDAIANNARAARRNRPPQISFALYHTWHIQHDVRIRSGLAQLDLLDGDAVGRRGGQPRHEVELQAGYAWKGLGARISAEWESRRTAPILLGTDGGSLDELTFTRIPRLNMRLFVDLGAQPWLRNVPWLRGRLNINIEDVLNSRTRVENRDSETPLAFDRSYSEPVGRAIRLTLRKNFRSR